jgi:SAM-dependent methyltransferase
MATIRCKRVSYLQLWGRFATAEQNETQAEGIWELLGLREGSRILDAPCGYGRISRLLAIHGATVLGVDHSAELLGRAEADRDDVPLDRLRYFRADLRSLVRFHGLLAPNSSLRSQVVPADVSTTASAEPQRPLQLELWDTNPDRDRPAKRYACGRHPWAWLVRRVFKEDVTVCPRCQGRLRVIEIVTESEAIKRTEQGLCPIPPP